MAVYCSHCREELIGAVNRCWRCGQPIKADSFEGTLPPVRRVPDESDPKSSSPETLPVSTGPVMRPSRPPSVRSHFADSCAAASLVVGLLSCLSALLTVWAIVPAALGIGLGVAGLRGTWTRQALMGILLSSLALCGSAARLGWNVYEERERRQQELLYGGDLIDD